MPPREARSKIHLTWFQIHIIHVVLRFHFRLDEFLVSSYFMVTSYQGITWSQVWKHQGLILLSKWENSTNQAHKDCYYYNTAPSPKMKDTLYRMTGQVNKSRLCCIRAKSTSLESFDYRSFLTELGRCCFKWSCWPPLPITATAGEPGCIAQRLCTTKNFRN